VQYSWYLPAYQPAPASQESATSRFYYYMIVRKNDPEASLGAALLRDPGRARASCSNSTARRQHASLLDAAFAVVRSIVGPAMLYLPHALASAGLAAGAAIFAVSYGLFILGTARLVACWCWRTDKRSCAGTNRTSDDDQPPGEEKLVGYSELALELAGPRAQLLVQLCIISVQAGVGVSYFIFVAENVQSVLSAVWDLSVPAGPVMLAMALIEVPLCLRGRDLTWLAPVNAAANGCVLTSLVIIILACAVSCNRSHSITTLHL